MGECLGRVVIGTVDVLVFLARMISAESFAFSHALTLVRTLYSQLSTFSGTPAMLHVRGRRWRGSSEHDLTIISHHHLGRHAGYHTLLMRGRRHIRKKECESKLVGIMNRQIERSLQINAELE